VDGRDKPAMTEVFLRVFHVPSAHLAFVGRLHMRWAAAGSGVTLVIATGCGMAPRGADQHRGVQEASRS